MEDPDTPMLTEIELRNLYAILQRRALDIGTHGPSRVSQLYAAMQSPTPMDGHADKYTRALSEAMGHALRAIRLSRSALPFLEAAVSMIENTAMALTLAEGKESLRRIVMVLETAADLIGEGEARLARSARIEVS
ncbi:hypothetical protein AB4Y38_24765 [Paraburkholderia sp. EG285A]|uniref:hypothetical protein n=1 Tax=Paraburkholderia sp. EG285A TaxID=3237009 RepID=UPI0034D19854